jgi:5-methylcytosine-specific restriction endonuclease McrA
MAHPEKGREYTRRWGAKNPEKIKEKNRRWREMNPEKARAKDQRRRARKKLLIAQLTANEWLWLLEQSGHRCVYCGKHQDEVGKLVQEHTVPVAQGGAYTISNIRPACVSCNSRKHAKTPEQAAMTQIIEINTLAQMEQRSLL